MYIKRFECVVNFKVILYFGRLTKVQWVEHVSLNLVGWVKFPFGLYPRLE